jgi:hypothetical protein
MPKAGTYFFSTLLEKLGFEDTGYHLSRDNYLDTKAHPLEVNATHPDKARVQRFFVPVVRELPARAVLAGHFALPLNFNVLGLKGVYLCAYRDPRKTLISEFIDFRFRRKDIPWLSRPVIADDREAFAAYLRHHGILAHLGIFREFVLLRSVVVSPLAPPVLQKNTYFVNFDHLRSEPRTALGIAKFLHADLTDAEVLQRVKAALSAETKTKATAIDIDRDAFWTEEAEEIYARSKFPAVKEMAENLGLEF